MGGGVSHASLGNIVNHLTHQQRKIPPFSEEQLFRNEEEKQPLSPKSEQKLPYNGKV